MKTILVTGATDGIGLATSAQLATEGARVVMVGRDAAKTERAVAQVRRRSGSAAVDSLLCDLSSLSAVRTLAEDVRASYERLDVVVNNAGAVFDRRMLTDDGIEATFAVNHLAGFLLTELLLDRVVASAPARIVFTSSVGHYGGTIDFDDVGFERGYQIMRAYFRSKLANVLYTRHLARRLEGTGVTSNALHPGTVATNIWSGAPRFARPVLAVAKRVMMVPPEKGGRAVTYLATSPEVEGRTGGYYEGNRLKDPSALARDDALAERLYHESARLVGLPVG